MMETNEPGRTKAIERVALYARVSTKDGRQDTEINSSPCANAVRSRDVLVEYVDHETDGTSKRQHFCRVFTDARARKFDLALFWSLDRLCREGVSATLNHLETRVFSQADIDRMLDHRLPEAIPPKERRKIVIG